ncbi:DUF6973 domain-containing protein [Dyadobacter bucti]|uniref:DUF6973 domain-containing protein n=1 Tax=Dyadobacter bucti TaxID=2572203 RepID=UPI003F716553
MKIKYKMEWGIAASFMLSVVSCQEQTSSITTENFVEPVYIYFQSERVLKPTNLTVADFNEYLSETKADTVTSPTNRISEERYSYLEGVSEDFYFTALENALKKYPDLSKTDFDESEVRQLAQYIPSITTSEIAVEKKGIIWDYLNVLIKRDVRDFIVANRGKYGLKTNDIITPWGLTAYDIYVMNSDPLAANCWGLARLGADEARKEKYGDDDRPNHPCNEYKHAMLNALSVGEMNLRNPDKQFGIRTTRRFANAHEYVPSDGNIDNLNQSWNLGNGHSNGMDLHNNLVGRTYMQDEVTVFLGHVFWVPSRNKIKNDIYNFGRIWISDGNAIRLRNPDRTWSILGDKENGRNYDIYPAVHKTLAHLEEL